MNQIFKPYIIRPKLKNPNDILLEALLNFLTIQTLSKNNPNDICLKLKKLYKLYNAKKNKNKNLDICRNQPTFENFKLHIFNDQKH